MSRSSPDKLHTRPGSHTDAAPGTPADQAKASAEQPETSVHPLEPEHPRTTGTSRSRQPGALGVNVDGQEAGRAGQAGHEAEEHPETPAGQHATGSFTDKKSRRKTA